MISTAQSAVSASVVRSREDIEIASQVRRVRAGSGRRELQRPTGSRSACAGEYIRRLAPDSPTDSKPPPAQHPKGWRVDPAPDGRGAPPPEKPPMIPRSRAFVAFLLGLLAVNLLISFLTSGPADRPRVPYQPFFINHVNANIVGEISSQEVSIGGTI